MTGQVVVALVATAVALYALLRNTSTAVSTSNSSVDTSNCPNNALKDGTNWRGLVDNHFALAKTPSKIFSVPEALILAILIHENRMQNTKGKAGELGAAQIYPPTLITLRQKYPILISLNPEKLGDAFFFAAAHLNMTAKQLGIAVDSPINILAYNRGANGTRGVDALTNCYSANAFSLYQAVKNYLG